jgi:uncharacterized protein YutE (UPF0331/DUF86 family)
MTKIILERLQKLRLYVKILRQLAAYPRDQLTKDPILMGSAERYLQISIETCLDIANHIISLRHIKSPDTYAEAFQLLSEYGIFSPEFGQEMQTMARFRNRLVHLYWEIEAQMIYEILTSRLGAFDRFSEVISNYIQKEQ